MQETVTDKYPKFDEIEKEPEDFLKSVPVRHTRKAKRTKLLTKHDSGICNKCNCYSDCTEEFKNGAVIEFTGTRENCVIHKSMLAYKNYQEETNEQKEKDEFDIDGNE